MAEDVHHNARRHANGLEQRVARVPEIMEAQPAKTSRREPSLKHVGDHRAVQRLSPVRGEDEIQIVLPAAIPVRRIGWNDYQSSPAR